MPVSKKRKKPEKKRDRSRDSEGAPQPAPAQTESDGGGLLSRMRGGIKNVAGAGPQKKEPLWSKILTWALVAVAAWFVAKRLGIIP